MRAVSLRHFGSGMLQVFDDLLLVFVCDDDFVFGRDIGKKDRQTSKKGIGTLFFSSLFPFP